MPGGHVPGGHGHVPCARSQIRICHVRNGKWEMGFWDLGVGVDLNRGVAVAGGSWLVGARKGNKQTNFGSEF
jgi:hypothetical protein